MVSEHQAVRPVLPPNAPVHFVRYAYKGGGLCEAIRDRHFGALWNGKFLPSTNSERDDSAEKLITHIAGDARNKEEPPFAFTLLPEHVTCDRCRELLNLAPAGLTHIHQRLAEISAAQIIDGEEERHFLRHLFLLVEQTDEVLDAKDRLREYVAKRKAGDALAYFNLADLELVLGLRA